MFERFTDRARRVLVHAQEEARLLQHNFIGTEHILLGLIREDQGIAARALRSLDISLGTVREKVAETASPAAEPSTGSPPFTPRAKKVLELSLREALQLGHNYIGTEHMLLGLVREGEGIAAQVLVSLGADLSRVRQTVLQLLGGYQAAGPEGHEEGLGMSRAGMVREAMLGPALLEARPRPLCPYCRSALEGNLRYTTLAAKGTGPDQPPVTWSLVYCDICGRAIGPATGGEPSGQT